MSLTLEEFGVDLFHAIRCVGGLLASQDQHNAAVYVNDVNEQASIKQRREKLITELIERMDKLTVEQQTELAHRYPMIGKL